MTLLLLAHSPYKQPIDSNVFLRFSTHHNFFFSSLCFVQFNFYSSVDRERARSRTLFFPSVWIVWFIVLFNDVLCVAWTWKLENEQQKKRITKLYGLVMYLSIHRQVQGFLKPPNFEIDQYNHSLCNSHTINNYSP